MNVINSLISSAGFFVLLATHANAALNQYGFPAQCSIYQACQDGVCVRVYLPVSSVIIFAENDVYSMASSLDGQRYKLGYFETLEEAKLSVDGYEDRDFGSVVIPNNEVADAFGMNFHSTISRGGYTTVSDDVTKLVCSAIRINGELN